MRASACSLVLAALALALTAVPAFPADAAAPVADVATTAPLAIAGAFLDQLDAGDFAGAEARFTVQMASAVPAAKLKAVWDSLPQQAGPAKGRGEARLAKHDDMHVVIIPLHHEKAELLAQIAIDADGRIAGFLVQPAPPPPAAAPASDAGFTEQAFSVGNDDRALPGTLSLPKARAPSAGFPAVVLVHGSGPQDRDETVGANRPFLDIARGLATQGIAVLRYDKRTKARPQDFAAGDYDVDDETSNDAVAAVTALGTAQGIDPDRIYILGHSQGAMLAPRIAARSGHVAGLIMLAAPARPLLDLLPEQNRYLFNADGVIGPAEQAFLDDLDGKIARVRGNEPMPTADAPLGVPASYWRHFDRIDPVADALATSLPMLLLQGGRDFQVIDTDWQLWRAALAGRPNATLKHYPALNHLGIAGEGAGTLEEYQTPGHVDPTLIQDVAEWIGR